MRSDDMVPYIQELNRYDGVEHNTALTHFHDQEQMRYDKREHQFLGQIKGTCATQNSQLIADWSSTAQESKI